MFSLKFQTHTPARLPFIQYLVSLCMLRAVKSVDAQVGLESPAAVTDVSKL